MPSPTERLQSYLNARGQGRDVQALTADASTREYFRMVWDGMSAVACVYPEPFTASVASYEDVTQLFTAAGLPVAELYDVEKNLGIVVQEDMGDSILREWLQDAQPDEHERLIDEAIALIARIQAGTDVAFERRSLASRLRFDAEKLTWELNYFKEHYFGTYLEKGLSGVEDAALTREFIELSAELAQYAAVLCHRDYHAANLMLDAHHRLRIIDHQDARIGSPAYDLVSLLLDRVTAAPSEDYLTAKRRLLLSERAKRGLPPIDDTVFESEFTLQAIQRCLKAAGTFSYQSTARGKTHFIQYIDPMLDIAAAAAAKLERFPAIREMARRGDGQPARS